MPFLSRTEFRRIVTPQLADTLAPDEDAFESAERDASEVATRLSGYAVPENAEEAPSSVKRPVAHLIVFALIGTASTPPDQLAWARQVEARAREDLAAERLRQAARPASGEGASRVGQVEHTISW